MKKVLIILIVALWSVPQSAAGQYLSVDNLSLQVGAEYPLMRSSIDNGPYGDKTDFNLKPHVRLSYRLPLLEIAETRVNVGYGHLGFFDEYKVSSDARRLQLKLKTLSIGLQGMIEVSTFKIGPTLNWRTLLSSVYQFSYKKKGQWETVVSDNAFGDNNLANNLFELGFIVQRPIMEQLSLSFEGIYGLNDMFIKDIGKTQKINIKWYLQHYRLSVGYSF